MTALDSSPQYRVDVTTTIPMQRLAAGSRKLVRAYPAVYLGASADRLTWGLTRDWHYPPELRAKWGPEAVAEMKLDAGFAHYSYRIDHAAELRETLGSLRALPERYHWWHFDAGSERYDALRTHLDDLERALVTLGVLS